MKLLDLNNGKIIKAFNGHKDKMKTIIKFVHPKYRMFINSRSISRINKIIGRKIKTLNLIVCLLIYTIF